VYFSVAAKLFDPGFVAAMPARAQTDVLVSAIRSADNELPSWDHPTAGKEDFTQYKVRGHYEKNEALQRYFRGMMWFGRRNFLLSEKTSTLAGILVPSILDEAGEAARFGTVNALTTYLIGPQDKYTLAGYRSVNRKIFGTEAPGFQQLTSNLEQNVASFQQA